MFGVIREHDVYFQPATQRGDITAERGKVQVVVALDLGHVRLRDAQRPGKLGLRDAARLALLREPEHGVVCQTKFFDPLLPLGIGVHPFSQHLEVLASTH